MNWLVNKCAKLKRLHVFFSICYDTYLIKYVSVLKFWQQDIWTGLLDKTLKVATFTLTCHGNERFIAPLN